MSEIWRRSIPSGANTIAFHRSESIRSVDVWTWSEKLPSRNLLAESHGITSASVCVFVGSKPPLASVCVVDAAAVVTETLVRRGSSVVSEVSVCIFRPKWRTYLAFMGPLPRSEIWHGRSVPVPIVDPCCCCGRPAEGAGRVSPICGGGPRDGPFGGNSAAWNHPIPIPSSIWTLMRAVSRSGKSKPIPGR